MFFATRMPVIFLFKITLFLFHKSKCRVLIFNMEVLAWLLVGNILCLKLQRRGDRSLFGIWFVDKYLILPNKVSGVFISCKSAAIQKRILPESKILYVMDDK